MRFEDEHPAPLPACDSPARARAASCDHAGPGQWGARCGRLPRPPVVRQDRRHARQQRRPAAPRDLGADSPAARPLGPDRRGRHRRRHSGRPPCRPPCPTPSAGGDEPLFRARPAAAPRVPRQHALGAPAEDHVAGRRYAVRRLAVVPAREPRDLRRAVRAPAAHAVPELAARRSRDASDRRGSPD